MVLTVYFVFAVTLCSCVAIPTPPTPPMHPPTPPMPPLPSGCDYHGKHYGVGESFSQSLCEHCQCAPGNQTYCTMAECLFTPCVDYVQEPGKCCPSCPNGENCKTSDGTVLKNGDIYRPDSSTTCKCPSDTFGLVGNVALCAST